MSNIDNSEDILDSRDIIERIDELESSNQLDDDEAHELEALKSLADEASGSPDWTYGGTLIRDSYFEDYAQELAEDCGMIPKGLSWPCIDWEQAARELQMDYFSVNFDGVDYWIRS
jgi:hypothetical protein